MNLRGDKARKINKYCKERMYCQPYRRDAGKDEKRLAQNGRRVVLFGAVFITTTALTRRQSENEK